MTLGVFGRTAFQLQAQNVAMDSAILKTGQLSVAMGKAEQSGSSFAAGSQRSQITLENFGRTFDNATRKVLVWQFAIMAVYGVIRKFGETLEIWRDFEVTLARISITTGAMGSKLASYFKEVADVAIEFGMPVEQTLTGMDLALRATAGSAQKTATAVALLRDASILANITGMQYNQSIDILVGSLRQSGLELNKGQILLDKWVAVAKTAAVSVNDLSQGFAIMADAGRAAGLTVDQINGLIAALSETVTLGPVQVGNAIRALMSTLYNPGSISLLQKYGVAVRDTQGEVRSFWEVMSQLSAMKAADVLDESVWLEIAKAAGAGQRRYAQFLALLNNFSKAMQVAGTSATAEGQAMEANAKIVETLTNTWDKFTAAQRKFLFAFGKGTGTIGGLTDALQSLTNVFSTMADAGEGIWSLGRAIMFLVGTLASLKIASLAVGWLGLGAKGGAFLGRFGGVLGAQVAGTGAATRAIRLGGYTTAQAAADAGIGTMAPGIAARRGMLGLSGLVPGQTNRAIRNLPEMRGIQWSGGAWRGAGGRFAPVPSLGGQPMMPMTWRGVGRGLTRPSAWGGAGAGAGRFMPSMGGLVGGAAIGLGAGALTGEWQTGVGAGIGSAIGFALAGPAGMVAGGLIGGVIGHVAADAFISQEDRIKKMFEGVSEDFGLNAEEMLSKYYAAARGGGETALRAIAAGAAPKLPERRATEAKSVIERFFSGYGSPVLFGAAKGETAWKRGKGAMDELNLALANGVITSEEYWRANKKTYIAWDELSDVAKAYMSTIRLVGFSNDETTASAVAYAQAVREQAEQLRNLAAIDNRYSDSQSRIRDLMKETGAVIDGVTAKEWEQANIHKLLRDQVNKTNEDFQKWYDVLLGSGYGYTAHIEAIERLKPLIESLGGTIEAIPEDKWLMIQRWDTNFATKLGEATQTLSDMKDEIDKFTIDFPDMLELANIEGTIADIDKVREALTALSEDTGEKKYKEAIEAIEQYFGDVMQRDITAKQLETYAGIATGYQRPTQVRLTEAEVIKAYRENLGRLPAFTELAKSLGKTEESVLTLIDPLTGEALRLEENTLALEMLARIVQDNTSAQEKRLEAEYNLPGGYQRPNRYSALKTLGPSYGGFGEAQEGLWGNWMEFIRDRGMQGGGVVHQTGPYWLHKAETVVSGDTMASTNAILGNSYGVQAKSAEYLASINLGILGLRQEIQQLRQQLASRTSSEEGSTNFDRMTKANYNAISSLGVRR